MNNKPLQINLKKIIRSRISSKANKMIPDFAISWLEKIICQDDLNGILNRTYPKEGVEFADAALKDLNISLDVVGIENIPENGRYIFASNHPLGGLDGIALIKILGSIYGNDGFKFLVNDMLMNVAPLKPVFLPINKYGSQGKEAAKQINSTYESSAQILVFPAGLVSRKHKDGKIKDLEWQKAFVAKAIEYKRDIIPIYFDGQNSSFFYNLAYWRKKLGIKVNIEQIFLPSELCKSKGKNFKIIVGKPISYKTFEIEGKKMKSIANEIKEKTYQMAIR